MKSWSKENVELGCTVYSWIGLVNDEDGQPVDVPDYADKSADIEGVFGAGGSAVIEGTNKPSSPLSYKTLNDPQGNQISVTSAKIETILENVKTLRPRVVGGDGTTAINVYLLVRTSIVGRNS